MAENGSYTLIIRVSEPFTLKVGSLGEVDFPEGFYAYNGSAFGPGGFKRIERHRRKVRGEGKTHWHIDYLLENSKSEIVEVRKYPGKDVECDLSQTNLDAIEDFGCSDCGCESHLFYSERLDLLQEIIPG